MSGDREPLPDVLSRHRRVVRALMMSAGDGDLASPYVVRRLADHVAAAGAWEELAEAPYLLDRLDPDSVAAAALRSAFGRSDLPGAIAASLSARHLFNLICPEDRLMTRWIAIACGSRSQATDSHAWARIGEREPPHVAMFGHKGAVRAIVPWSRPDDAVLLLTSGDDGAVRVWDPTTGRPASEPLIDQGPPLMSLATMTVNQRRLLGGGGPGGIRLWDLETGATVGSETAESRSAVRQLTVLPQPDGAVLLGSAEDNGAVRLWRVRPDGLTPEGLLRPRSRVQAMATFSQADGRIQVVTAGYDGYLRFWDPVTEVEAGSYPVRGGAGYLINAVTAAEDMSMLSVSGDDGSVELLEFGDDGSVTSPGVLSVAGTERLFTAAMVRLSGGPVLVAAAGERGTVHLFDVTAGQELSSKSSMAGHRGDVYAAVFVGLGDGRTLLATGGEEGTVRLWHPDPRGSPYDSAADESRRVQAIATMTLERRDVLATGDDRGTVQLHDVESGLPVGNRYVGHRGAVHAVATARLPDGRRILVTGGAERSVQVWDVATGHLLANPLRGHQATIYAVTVLRNGRDKSRVASAGADSMIRLWDAVSGHSIGSPLGGHRGPIRCLAAAPSPAGPDILISGGDDGVLRLWRTDSSGTAEFHRIDFPGSVAAIAVIIDASRAPVVAAGGSEGVIRLWDVVTGGARGFLSGETRAEITALAVMPVRTGPLLVAASRDGAVRVWNPESGQLMRTILLPFGQQPRGLATVRSHLTISTERGFLGCELDPRLSRELPS